MRSAVLVFALGLTASGAAAAQEPVRVWASLSSSAVQLGRTTVLELHIETRGAGPEQIVPPTLPSELEIVGTSDYSQIQFSLPGGRSRLVRREMVLRPTATGRFRIPEFTVTVQGKDYRTAALTLTVGAGAGGGGGAAAARGSSRALPPGSVTAGSADEVLFSSRLLPDTVYIGQQVTLRSDVMVSEGAQFRLRRAPEYEPPDAPGFWVHDLPDTTGAVPRIIGGQVYFGRTLTRAYFPLGVGRITLEPAKLRYEIRRGVLYTPQSQELASDSLRLTVLPLPQRGRPSSFTGAVGRFRVDASVEPAEVPAGEAVALTVVVEGEGNIKAVPPPVLPDLSSAQVFAPTEEAEIHPVAGRVGGVKRFTWVLVPSTPGRLDIPPIEYAYFDPERRAYQVARASALVLDVGAGAGTVTPVPGAAATEIHYLKPRPRPRSPLGWVRSPWFAGIQLLPLVGMIWFLIDRRRGVRRRALSRRARRRRLRDGCEKLRRRAGGNPATWFRDLDALIRDWLAVRIGEPDTRKAESHAVREALGAVGVADATARAVAELLDEMARGRFEPNPPDSATRLELVDRAERLLLAVDRETSVPARPAPSVGLALILVLSTVGVCRAQAEDDFSRGIELYRVGDYPAASEAFTAYVDAHPADANGWYNLGTARYQAGDRGRAVQAWLRVLQLAPRDTDARHNLGVVAADPWLVRRAAPIVPLATDELLLVAALAWLVGAGAGILFLRRRRRGGAVAAALGLGLAVALVSAWSIGVMRVHVGVVLPEEAHLRAAPHLRAEELRTIDAGAGVLLLERDGAWLHVRLPDGGEGWVEAAQVGAL